MHPVLSYVLSDFCLYWPHNVPTRDPRWFHPSMNMEEVVEALPVWNTTTDDQVSEARLVLQRAKLWAEGFRPYFPQPWDAAVRAYMRNADGRIVKYQAEHGGTLCVEATGQGDRLRYGRITGLDRYAGPAAVNIDGWNAYEARGPIGLDPAAWYCIFPGEPAGLPVTLTGLPAGAVVRGVRITDQYCLDEIAGAGRGRVTWQSAGPLARVVAAGQTLASTATSAELQLPAAVLFALQPAPELPLDTLLPLERWPVFLVSRGQILRPGKLLRTGKFTIDNVSHVGHMVLPPLGGKESELSVEKLVALPPGRGLALQVSLGRLGGPGDGVHFVVRVNGQEIWRQYRDHQRGWKDAAIDLTAYAGQTVVLSLAVDCGPGGANLSCDESIWGDPKLVRTAPPVH